MTPMRRHVLWLAAALFVLTGPGRPAQADPNEAAKVFEELYGQRLGRVQASRPTEDDLALAAEMIAGSEQAAASPPLARRMLETAFDLTHKIRDGYPTAEQALDAGGVHGMGDGSGEGRLGEQ